MRRYIAGWMLLLLCGSDAFSAESFSSGETYFEQGNYEQAKQELQKAIDEGGSTVDEAQYLTALCEFNLNNFDAFSQKLEEFGRLYPEDPRGADLEFYHALTLSNQGNFEEAKIELEAFKEEYPNFTPTTTHSPSVAKIESTLASYYYFTGARDEYALAVDHFQQTFPGHEDLEILLFYDAMNQCQKGNLEEGSRRLKSCIQSNPNSALSVEARKNLASVEFQLGMELTKAKNWEEAYSRFVFVRELDQPATVTETSDYFALQCLYQAGEAERFGQDLAAFRTKYPNDRIHQTEVAVAAATMRLQDADHPAQTGDYAQANQELTTYLEENLDAPMRESVKAGVASIRSTLGMRLSQEGKWQEAYTYFSSIRELDQPTTVTVTSDYFAMQALFELGDLDQFEGKLGEYQNRYPGILTHSVEIAFSKAMAPYLRDDYASGTQKLLEFIQNHPESEQASTAKFYLANLPYNEMKWGNAIPAFEQFIANHPDKFQLIWSCKTKLGYAKAMLAVEKEEQGLSDEAVRLREENHELQEGFRTWAASSLNVAGSESGRHSLEIMILESWYFEWDFHQVEREARYLIARYPEGSMMGATGQAWLGFALYHQKPPDLDGAREAFSKATHSDSITRERLLNGMPETAQKWKEFLQNQGP